MLWREQQEFWGNLLDKQRRKHFLQCAKLQEADSSSYENIITYRSRSNCLGLNASSASYHQLCDIDIQLVSLLGSLLCKVETMRVSTSKGGCEV